jgi:hypothetical protein
MSSLSNPAAARVSVVTGGLPAPPDIADWSGLIGEGQAGASYAATMPAVVPRATQGQVVMRIANAVEQLMARIADWEASQHPAEQPEPTDRARRGPGRSDIGLRDKAG